MRIVAVVFMYLSFSLLSSCRPKDKSGSDIAPVDPIEREYGYFQTLDPAQQRQIRELDHWLSDPENEHRARLEHALNDFNFWLSQVSEPDRQSVISEKNWDERLKAIKRLKERDWIDSLPKIYRDKYAKASPAERIRLVDFWREEQKERRDEWQFVRHNWEDIHNEKIPALFQGEKFRKDLANFVAHLETQLPPQDKKNLAKFLEQPPEEREWFKYVRAVVDLADKHPLMPGPLNGPRTFEELPKSARDALEKGNPKVFSKRENYPKRLQNAEGRWPDFAVAITDHARSHRIFLPKQLGPATKAEMPIEVQEAVDKLEQLLKRQEKNDKGEKAEQAGKDLKTLKESEGKWPDYPRAAMDLGRQYKIEITNWVLPGVNTQLWDRFRTSKGLKKT